MSAYGPRVSICTSRGTAPRTFQRVPSRSSTESRSGCTAMSASSHGRRGRRVPRPARAFRVDPEAVLDRTQDACATGVKQPRGDVGDSKVMAREQPRDRLTGRAGEHIDERAGEQGIEALVRERETERVLA